MRSGANSLELWTGECLAKVSDEDEMISAHLFKIVERTLTGLNSWAMAWIPAAFIGNEFEW